MNDTIIESIARTLFVTAYADHCEECEGCEICEEHGSATNGQDWMDVAPDTNGKATVTAQAFALAFLYRNGCDLANAYKLASTEPGKHRRTPTPEDFGYCLAMESLGHGVGWSDDHPDHGFKIPRYEGEIL